MVLDIAGKVVWQYTVEEGDPAYVNWDLTNLNNRPLADGLYMYFFLSDDGEMSDVKRLVIER
jgi:hypothetical protein